MHISKHRRRDCGSIKADNEEAMQMKATKYKTFGGKRYEHSIGGQPGRKFTKSFATAHAELARKAGMNARVVNLVDLGWAVYTRKTDPMRTWY